MAIEHKTFNYGTRDMLFEDNELDIESIKNKIFKNLIKILIKL